MQNNLYDVKTIVNMYLDYFMNGFTISTFILSIYLLYSAVFIFHYSFKGIILTIILLLFAYTIYLLVYDITYVQYLMSLRLDESFRLLFFHYFPLFSLSKHAPSKALPKFNLSHLNFIKMKWETSYVMKTYYKYLLDVQKRLLYISRIYILILDFPLTENKYYICSKDTIIKNKEKSLDIISSYFKE